MDCLSFLAEQKINDALRKGTLTPERLKGKPLKFEDDSFVPAELKMAYKILKNSGYLPPEVTERREVKQLEDLIEHSEDEHERLRQMKKLQILLMKVDARRGFRSRITEQDEYYRQVVEHITTHKGGKKDG